MAAPVKIGETLAGKYTVERVLGVGGMGVVVAAKHIHLGERVAIKFLLPHALAREDVVKRFLQEGQAAARMKSEHIARVRDVGTLDDGAPYLVMEYLDGNDLGAILREKGTFPIEVAVGYILQACEALADAHAAGVIHRDLKPGNLFLTRKNDGTPVLKIIDFGISKVGVTGEAGPPDPGAGEMTATAVMMGSPLYMAPEQMASARDVDGRSDIWSLGIILHALVTGQPPFKAPSVMQVYELIMAGAPPLREVLPGAPEGLEKVVLKCLQKNRKDRYDNVADLAAALVEFGPAGARESAERTARILRVNSGKGSEPPLATPTPPPTPGATPAAPEDGEISGQKRQEMRSGTSGASLSASVPGDLHASQGPWDRGGVEPSRGRPSRSVLVVVGVGAVVVGAGIFALLRGDHHPGSPLPPAAESAVTTSSVVAATLPRDPLVPTIAPAPPAGSASAAAEVSAAPPVVVAPSAAVIPVVTTSRGRPSSPRPPKPAVDPFGGGQK